MVDKQIPRYVTFPSFLDLEMLSYDCGTSIEPHNFLLTLWTKYGTHLLVQALLVMCKPTPLLGCGLELIYSASIDQRSSIHSPSA
jgi:hypothetical protein